MRKLHCIEQREAVDCVYVQINYFTQQSRPPRIPSSGLLCFVELDHRHQHTEMRNVEFVWHVHRALSHTA